MQRSETGQRFVDRALREELSLKRILNFLQIDLTQSWDCY